MLLHAFQPTLPFACKQEEGDSCPVCSLGLPSSPTSASFHQLEPRYLIKQEIFCTRLSPDLGLK